MNDSILLLMAIAVVVWLFIRRGRIARQRQLMHARETQGLQPDEARSMPRLGQPGTITRAQMRSLAANDFHPSRQWSREEAQLILDALAYLRAAIKTVTGEANAPVEVQNKILGLILSDDDLRDYVLDWSRNLTREEEDETEIELPADDRFERVAGAIRELWEE